MGCSNSNSNDDIKRLNSFNLTNTYTHEETSSILCVAVKNYSTIVYGIKDMIKIFNAKTRTAEDFSNEHKGGVNGMKFLSSGLLLTYGEDKLIKIWDVTKNKSLFTLEGHSASICDIIELKDGRLLSTGEDNKMIIWSMKNKSMDYILSEGVEHFAYQTQIGSGLIAVTGGKTKKIMFWDLDTRKMADSVEMDQEVYAICALFDRKLAVGCGNGEIRIINPRDMSVAFTLKEEEPKCTKILREIEIGWLMAISDGNTVTMWNLKAPGEKSELVSHKKTITDADKIADRMIVTVSKDKTLKIWQ
ncbi:MAG: hypothetical protein MJ252_25140 [archaeon]|nr:hypothetical protein [archaeon]